VPDKRLLMRVTAALIVGGTLLTGCGSQPRSAPPARAETSAPAPSSAAAATSAATATKGADADLDNADTLLQQVDSQVSAAEQTPDDAD
jgi:hypothetical protein